MTEETGRKSDSGADRRRTMTKNAGQRRTGSEEREPLFEKAVALLSYRAHARKELAEKLRRKTGCEERELEEVLDRLEELGFLDDRSYAGQVVRSCGRKGYGRQRALAELVRRGIPEELREEALAEMPKTEDALERFIRARLRDPEDRDEVRRVSAAAVRRGFSWEEVRRAVEKLEE